LINHLKWKAFFMWALCCPKVEWVSKIWNMTFLTLLMISLPNILFRIPNYTFWKFEKLERFIHLFARGCKNNIKNENKFFFCLFEWSNTLIFWSLTNIICTNIWSWLWFCNFMEDFNYITFWVNNNPLLKIIYKTLFKVKTRCLPTN